MIKAVLAALIGSALVGAIVYEMWLDFTARFMGEQVIFNVESALLFVFPFALIYTAVIGMPLGLAANWILNKTKQTGLWAYLGSGFALSLLLVVWREPYGLATFSRPGGDGLANSLMAIGISAPLIFWTMHVRHKRRVRG